MITGTKQMTLGALLLWGLSVQAAPLVPRMWAAADARNANDPVFEQALKSADSEDRRVAAIALGRIGGEAVLPKLDQLLADEDKEVQRASIIALGISDAEKADKILRSKLTKSSMDIDTLALTLKVLGNVGEPETQVSLIQDIIKPMLMRRGDKSAEKLLVAAEQGLGLLWSYRRERLAAPSKEAPPLLYAATKREGDVGIMAAFALSRIRNEKGFLKPAEVMIALMGAPEPRAQFFLARTLGAQLDAKLYPEIMKLALTHKNASVRSELVFALLRDKDDKRAQQALQALLKQADEWSLIAAVQSVSENDARLQAWKKTLDEVAKRSPALKFSVEHAYRLAALPQAEETKEPASAPVAWEQVDAVRGARYNIVTNRGTIKVELNPETPYTSYNFAKLAEQKYYDGTLFFRVVPAFVAQGGDKDNTGNGGPGWSIREEISSWPHDIDHLGMASAGKDTAGSQFFFNTERNPHLDYHYTVFAQIVEGREVVRQLKPGDKIEKVTKAAE